MPQLEFLFFGDNFLLTFLLVLLFFFLLLLVSIYIYFKVNCNNKISDAFEKEHRFTTFFFFN